MIIDPDDNVKINIPMVIPQNTTTSKSKAAVKAKENENYSYYNKQMTRKINKLKSHEK